MTCGLLSCRISCDWFSLSNSQSPKVRGHYQKAYTHQDLTAAYNLVLEQGYSTNAAAKLFNVPESTLRDRIKRKEIMHLTQGHERLFTEKEEAALAGHYELMARIGHMFPHQEKVDLAFDYAVYLGIRDRDGPISIKWLYRFMERWPDVKGNSRSCCVGEDLKVALTQYFEELNKIMSENDILKKPSRVYMIDEKVLSASESSQSVPVDASKMITLIGGGNAIGNHIPPYLIFPRKSVLPGTVKDSTPGVSATFTESGCSDPRVYERYTKQHLIKFLPARDSSNKVLVLFNCNKYRISFGLMEWAKKRNIILFVAPPHCPSLLKCLEVSKYSPVELAWHESAGCSVTKCSICKIGSEAYSRDLSDVSIQDIFRKCGIFPFDSSAANDIYNSVRKPKPVKQRRARRKRNLSDEEEEEEEMEATTEDTTEDTTEVLSVDAVETRASGEQLFEVRTDNNEQVFIIKYV